MKSSNWWFYARKFILFSSTAIFLVIEEREAAIADGLSFNYKFVLCFKRLLFSRAIVLFDSPILCIFYTSFKSWVNFFLDFFIFYIFAMRFNHICKWLVIILTLVFCFNNYLCSSVTVGKNLLNNFFFTSCIFQPQSEISQSWNMSCSWWQITSCSWTQSFVGSPIVMCIQLWSNLHMITDSIIPLWISSFLESLQRMLMLGNFFCS